MSTRLLLEGPDVEAVLTRISEEHGPGARIVAADKIRSGGVAGFFAKEMVQVAIEVDDVAAPGGPAVGDGARSSAAGVSSAPASLLDLAAAADARDDASSTPSSSSTTAPAPAMTRTGNAASAAPVASTDGSDDVAATPIFSSLAQQGGEFASVLAELTSVADDPAGEGSSAQPVSARRPDAQASTLAPQVMADLAASFGTPKSFVPAVGLPTDSPASHEARRPTNATSTNTTSTNTTSEYAPRVGRCAAAVTSGRPMTPLQVQADRWLAENFPHLAKGAGSASGAETDAGVGAGEVMQVEDASWSAGSEGGMPSSWSVTAPAPERAERVTGPARTTPRPTAPSPFVPEGAGRGLVGQLVALGLPRELAETVELDPVSGLVGGIADALEASLPAPPPLMQHDVLVLVGDGATAYEVGRALARKRRLSPADVLLVAASDLGTGIARERHLRTPDELRRRLPEILVPGAPAVVVVDQPVGGDAGWTTGVVTALADCAVWAVVEATRKPADVSEHLRALGRVDALVVQDTAATRDPGSALAVALHHALPTALLGDRPGDAHAWASLLAARLQGRS